MSTDLDFEAVAEAFYAALFREAPDVERLFRDETNKTVMFVNALESISDMERGDPHFADFMDFAVASNGCTAQLRSCSRRKPPTVEVYYCSFAKLNPLLKCRENSLTHSGVKPSRPPYPAASARHFPQ